MQDFKELGGMKVDEDGNDLPMRRRDVVTFWCALAVSVVVVSVGGMELMRFMGWIQ